MNAVFFAANPKLAAVAEVPRDRWVFPDRRVRRANKVFRANRENPDRRVRRANKVFRANRDFAIAIVCPRES